MTKRDCINNPCHLKSELNCLVCKSLNAKLDAKIEALAKGRSK